ncbi:MAG TPA: adenylate/guanylate cyclase domain-containing protein [Acidimicrobiia bacterium]|jgi:class 3 adenylate cyclase/tetratricopeptide (TPR) repeat protein
MTDSTSAETRLGRLLDRLLKAAEDALHSGDLEQARATAEEVRAVDPENLRAERILRRVAARQLAPAGERALMTLLFSDLVGSTMLSEQVQPEELRDLFALYRAAAHEAVERYSGTVMHYAGDGILAGFGYPAPHEDDARRAVLAGLDLVTAMADARPGIERRLGAAVAVRVGIHTGRVVVTDLRRNGSVRERDSIVGVAPNLAARIQSEAHPDTVVISDVTHQLVDADFVMHSLGLRELKGISRPVEIFVVERPRYAGARFEAERYRKGGLVGRDAQREMLVDAWEHVRDGDQGGRAFLVVGEAGIGKTRLVAEVLDRVEAGGGSVLGAGSLPYYSNVSLWPIARALEHAIGEADLAALVGYLGCLELEPGEYVPFLAPLLGIEAPDHPAPELEPSAFRDETLNRIVSWMGALGASKPHLVILEDLHWADPSTVTLVGRLAQRCPRSVLVIATTRDASTIPWLDEVEVVHLGRLDKDAALRLVENVAGERELSEDLRRSIIERAGGVPLFVEELTRSCLESDRSDPIPLRLQELFTWRLKAPDVDLGVVQVAATVGPGFSASVVAEVVGDEVRVSDQIEVLVDEGIIEAGPGADSYRFRHALMRDAAYETQVLDNRIRTHARLAEVLTARGSEPAVIAEHLDRAGVPAQAAGLYLVAGQSEQARGAHTEAARLFTRAIELLDQVPESEDRDLQELMARMMRGLSVSSTQGYAAPEVQADHRRAEVLASRLDARLEVLPSLIAIWAYWLTSGDLSTARGLVDRLEDLIARPEFSWFEPCVESCAGWLDFYQGELDSARQHLERSVAGFRARPADQIVSPFWPLPNDPLAVSYIALACVSALHGDLNEADQWQTSAVRRSEEIGFPRGPFSLAFVKTYAAWIKRYLGDHDKARLLGAEVVGIGQSYGYAYWMLLGSSYVAAGQPGGAPERRFLEETISNIRLLGQEAFVASNLSYLAILNHEEGAVEEARSLVDEALDVVHKTGEYLHLPELLRHRARYSLELGGSMTEILADLKEALDVSQRQGARVAHLRAALAIARLPEEHRPSEWRQWLESARAGVAGSLGDTREADAVLAGTK